MFNIFKKPYEKGSLEAWAKACDDIAKIAFLAISAILFGDDILVLKVFKTILLMIGIYIFVLGGRICRQLIESTQPSKE